ncbi:MAG: hypothetical protein J7K54_02855, partial [Candidatus Aenigmarchaeota archaeon]|nr:hypothetical protein [Candidatus Aenigmarchaeota archaeon]
CKKCECSCPGTSLPESSGSGIIELLGFDESVEAGEAFETAVRVKNTGTNNTSFAIYSYGYQGSRCLTYGLSNGTWSKGWTGNAQSFSLGPGSYREVRLVNAFDNSTESGVYSFRVRVRHDGRQDDITRTVKVEAAKVEHEENKSGRDVEIVFEDAENTSNANTDGITGMATSEGREVSGLGSIYESFLRWLALVFKF